MANLGDIIAKKAQKDTQWKEDQQSARDNMAEMRDLAIVNMTNSPEAYCKYLELQGSNPMYSAGNIALVVLQAPKAAAIGTEERWVNVGRAVMNTEKDNGIKIYSKDKFSGYKIAHAYDITQTQGRAIKEANLENGSPEMEMALTTLLNYSPVQIVIEEELTVPAFYDEKKFQIAINPKYPDNEAFAEIATEVAHARFHNKGKNPYYERKPSELDASSVSYILCKRFGVACELPDTKAVKEAYEGMAIETVTELLNGIQNMAKQIGSSIERDTAPQQSRGRPANRSTR